MEDQPKNEQGSVSEESSSTSEGTEGQKGKSGIPNVYDTIFKFCTRVSKPVLIRFINSVFKRNHSLDSQIDYLNTETVGEILQSRISDMCVRITESNGDAIKEFNYLVEFQTYSDSSMSFRILEYALRKAWEQRIVKKNIAYFKLPNCAEIFLKGNPKMDEEGVAVLCDDDDQECFRFKYRIIQLLGRTFEENSEELLLLLPFEIMRFQDIMKNNPNDENAQNLINYEKKILTVFQNKRDNGILSVEDYTYLHDALSDLFAVTYADVPQFQKGGKLNMSAAEIQERLTNTIQLIDETRRLQEELKKTEEQLRSRDKQIAALQNQNRQLQTKLGLA